MALMACPDDSELLVPVLEEIRLGGGAAITRMLVPIAANV